MDTTEREAPNDVAQELGRKLRDRRETREKLEKLNAECDALAKRLAPLVPEQGMYITCGPHYDLSIVHLQRDRTRGVTASLVPTTAPGDLAWPEAPDKPLPTLAERTRRVDDTIRAVIGASELCTVPHDSDRDC